MRNLSFSAYCFNEIWQVLYLSQDIKKTVFKPWFSYKCPWSSKAVPCCPPISHTIMDSSKLPENNNRFSGSQARARTLPEKKKWEKKLTNKAKFLKPGFIQEIHWVHSFRMTQIRNMIWDHSNHGTSNSLKASSPGRFGGWVEKGRGACHHVSGIWIPPSIPLWLPVNWAVNPSEHQSVRSGKSTNGNKYWTIRAKGNDVITDVISTNQHFASTFSVQIFKFQRRNCKLSFLFPPHCQSTPDSLLAGYTSNELMNPFPGWICWFLWRVIIWILPDLVH